MDYAGIKIVSSPYLTEPVIRLSPDLDVSDEFRAKCNAFYEHLFGRKPAAYMVNNEYLAAHPEIVSAFREYADNRIEKMMMDALTGNSHNID